MTTRTDDIAEQRRTRQESRRARNSRRLAAMLAEREELAGVSPVADFVVESVRWTA